MKKTLFASLLIIILSIGGYLFYSRPSTPYYLSVAAIMKNEKPYLKEWLEYHLLQGVEHFYLCDNDSTDGTKEYLEPYIKQNIITYIPLSGANQQLVCYEKIVLEHKNDTTWLAIIDLDEFIVPLKAKNIPQFLKEFEDVSEVSLHWMNYGDNDTVSRKNGLLTEFFTSHGRFLNHTVKSIVKPKDVIDFKSFGSNHYVKVNGKSVNENHYPVDYMLSFYPSDDKARINHYILKSFAEFLYKKKRGHPEGTAIDYGYYFFHNDNSVKNDTSMLRFLPALKERIKKSPLKDVPLPAEENLSPSFDEIYFTPEEAGSILGREVLSPMNFKEVEKAYKVNRPQYRN